MPIPFFVSLLIGLALNILAYVIMPKPPTGQDQEYKDMDDPTAEAGKTIALMSGSMTIKGLNIIETANKAKIIRHTKSASKK